MCLFLISKTSVGIIYEHEKYEKSKYTSRDS